MKRTDSYIYFFESADLLKGDELPNIQVTLSSEQECIPIRHVNASHVNKLVKLPGICISAARTKPKATRIFVKCRTCSHGMMLKCQSTFGQVQMPRMCQAEKLEGEQKCPLDPYVVIPDRCKYVDTQYLKLQEAPESVPTGEMPRHVLLAADRTLSNRLSPGMRIVAIGIYDTFNSGAKAKLSAVAIRTPYLRVVGFELDTSGVPGMPSCTPEEEEQLMEISRQPQLYEKNRTIHCTINQWRLHRRYQTCDCVSTFRWICQGVRSLGEHEAEGGRSVVKRNDFFLFCFVLFSIHPPLSISILILLLQLIDCRTE